MPPKPKTLQEIENIRRKILNCAINIIIKNGYESLSMRKIATSMGMSATNIYNYYHNKDEVYLAILIEGYELLYQETLSGFQFAHNPKEKFECAIKAYVNFALEKPHYYEIMFSSHNPKYRDYIGKPLEQIAYNKKQTALKWFNCFKECVSEHLSCNDQESDTIMHTLRIVGQLHGAIDLYHNKILIEVCDDELDFVNRTIKWVTGGKA